MISPIVMSPYSAMTSNPHFTDIPSRPSDMMLCKKSEEPGCFRLNKTHEMLWSFSVLYGCDTDVIWVVIECQ